MTKIVPVLALALVGCAADPHDADGKNTAIWEDPSTGCRYLLYANGVGQARVGSLSIRFTEQGLPDCPGTREVRLISPVDLPTDTPVAP